MLRPRSPHGHYTVYTPILRQKIGGDVGPQDCLTYPDMQRANDCLFNCNRQLEKVQGFSLELNIPQSQPRRLRKSCMRAERLVPVL